MTHTKDKIRKQFDLKEPLNTSNYEKEDKPFDHNEKDVGSSVRDKPIYISKPTTAESLIRKYVYEGDDETRSCVTSRHRHRKILNKSQQHRKITKKNDDPLLLRTRKKAVKKIKKRIINRKIFFCDESGCGRSYVKAQSLLIHKRSHTGEKPYVCTIKDCGKRYSRVDSLKDHVMTHDGKLFICGIPGCDKSYFYSSHYLRHKKVHVTENVQGKIVKHKCLVPNCGKEYVFAKGLKKHMYIHSTERFECDHPGCARQFTYPKEFKRHKKTHN
ncbi:8777_t:CDS:2 [Funneliformis mosseae]|uniref:Wilms tumor protein homolog n=1 Tax=Funneliformis mosseae TaxID=27381 RepID=A0A9N8ZQ00_FUNMO|nr:8777_t:CDS:2 [Funneliformis mosseae]